MPARIQQQNKEKDKSTPIAQFNEVTNQGIYLMEKSCSERSLTRESGTLLFSSFRISDSGLLIPELATRSSSVSAAPTSFKLGEEVDLELEYGQRCGPSKSSSDFPRDLIFVFMLLHNAISFFSLFSFLKSQLDKVPLFQGREQYYITGAVSGPSNSSGPL